MPFIHIKQKGLLCKDWTIKLLQTWLTKGLNFDQAEHCIISQEKWMFTIWATNEILTFPL